MDLELSATSSALVVAGLGVAAFVGFNIGGSSTGVAFGPAVGSRIVGNVVAAALFTTFALFGDWTVGRNVIDTMSDGIVPADQFTLTASIAVLFFAGFALLVSNLYGVPASTSMTAVGAIGQEDPESLTGEQLFDAAATSRIVLLWVLTPSLSAVGSYLLFAVVL